MYVSYRICCQIRVKELGFCVVLKIYFEIERLAYIDFKNRCYKSHVCIICHYKSLFSYRVYQLGHFMSVDSGRRIPTKNSFSDFGSSDEDEEVILRQP